MPRAVHDGAISLWPVCPAQHVTEHIQTCAQKRCVTQTLCTVVHAAPCVLHIDCDGTRKREMWHEKKYLLCASNKEYVPHVKKAHAQSMRELGANVSQGHSGSLRTHTDCHDGPRVVRHVQGMRSYGVYKMSNVIIPHGLRS